MLQIKGINKRYVTGDYVQQALDNVSLNLRDSEFVAILGPSGSGKTTLLNIIGGLDRYDSGDLLINGVSTKKYKDRDWDRYRNHSVGFVFQSYNLIPHQTVLSNVELALTISGIPREERRRRAEEALREVGLGEQIHKKPNQLSGGQMQRVAVARALVNDPDILLADEPTGALDSETSLQIMELLKKVAEDRLVVMVTHNPDLADRYATRIVRLLDGKIASDSDPFEPEGAASDAASGAASSAPGKASMSFLTALSLSFNNLMTKKARTILIAFAGSIGIIGIALILSLSNGVNGYIHSVEEETLSEYPVEIDRTSINFSSMMGMDNRKKVMQNRSKKDVQEYQTVTNMFSQMDSNDLASLKEYLDENPKHLNKYTNAIEYKYGITPVIYRKTGKRSYRKVNPDETFSSLGMGESSGANSMMSSMLTTNSFYALPQDQALYRKQYDVKAGHWPKKYNEIVVVLAGEGKISDLALYTLGMKDVKELDKAVRDFRNEKRVDLTEKLASYDYEDFLGKEFRLVQAGKLYRYNKEYDFWEDCSDDEDLVYRTAEKGEKLKVVGVVQPKKGNDFQMLQSGLAYSPSLTAHVIRQSEDSTIVKAQLNEPDINVFTGKEFGGNESDIDLTKMFTVDPDGIRSAFRFDAGKLQEALSGAGSLKSGGIDMSSLVPSGSIHFSQKKMTALMQSLYRGYQKYTKGNAAADISGLSDGFSRYLQSSEFRSLLQSELQSQLSGALEGSISQETLQQLVESVMNGYEDYLTEHDYTDVTKTNEYIREYLQSSEAQTAMQSGLSKIVGSLDNVTLSDAQIRKLTRKVISGYTSYAKKHGLANPDSIRTAFTKYLNTKDAKKRIAAGVSGMVDAKKIRRGMASAIRSAMTSGMSGLSSQLAETMQSAITVDPNAFAGAISLNMTPKQLQNLMTSMLSSSQSSYENNLKKLGYADLDDPEQILIYPKDFEAKDKILAIIDGYNEDMKQAGDNDKIIAYTDLVGSMMDSVTKIVNAISYVLIAFVSISLVVSSIMIGVITYISVLERRKEIGILRAIGASKHNISNVFNAETFIIGALAGLIGVVVTWILLIPTNIIIRHVTDVVGIHAALPPAAAVILILLSIGLTLLGGLIPSRKAAKSDPVTALRTE